MHKRATPEPPRLCSHMQREMAEDALEDFLEPYKNKFMRNRFGVPKVAYNVTAECAALPGAAADSDVKVAFLGMFRAHCNPFELSLGEYKASVERAHAGVLPRLQDPNAAFSRRDMLDVVRTMGHAEVWLGIELARQFADNGDLEEENARLRTQLLTWIEGVPDAPPATCKREPSV